MDKKEIGFNPDLKDLLKDGTDSPVSRYSLVSATAKLARQLADDNTLPEDLKERLTKEKPVSIALEKLLDEEYKIVEPDEIKYR